MLSDTARDERKGVWKGQKRLTGYSVKTEVMGFHGSHENAKEVHAMRDLTSNNLMVVESGADAGRNDEGVVIHISKTFEIIRI